MKIPPIEYIHPDDKAALDNLMAIPLFPTCVKGFLKIFPEQLMYGMSMAQKIRLGAQQLPEIYQYLPPICEELGIAEPSFFLEMNPAPNAYTFGDSQIFMTVTSGLLEYLNEDEIKAVIAHECGHIACHHVLYHTMATMLLQYGSKIFGPLAAMAMPVQLALLYWQRRSELSADRAAAVVTNGCEGVVDTMIRLAGGPESITGRVNIEEYIKQAEDYNKSLEESHWQMILQGLAIMNQDHPFAAVRTREIKNWCETEHFQRLLQVKTEGVGENKCPHCWGDIVSDWKFCKHCGAKLN